MDLKNTKIIFMGTPEFSVPVLDLLIKETDLVAVVTQPDKKVGRKQEILPSPIKKLAQKNNVEVLQPEKIKSNLEFLNKIKDLKPDLIVVAAYGFILPNELLKIPKYGVLNVHSSLLPKYRGASPIQAAILNGDKKTGITIIKINKKMDEGDILSQAEIKIKDTDTFKTLHDNLSKLGAKLLIETLPKYINNEIKPRKQDESKVSYCQLITKADGEIDWHRSVKKIEQQVRAFDPWPGTWTVWGDKKLKILEVEVSNNNNIDEIGQVNNDLEVLCGDGVLKIKKLQLEGKKRMTNKEFLNGHPQINGQKLI